MVEGGLGAVDATGPLRTDPDEYFRWQVICEKTDEVAAICRNARQGEQRVCCFSLPLLQRCEWYRPRV